MRGDWYRVARVRRGDAGPRLDDEGPLFAAALAPHVAHPLVTRQGRGAVDELLRRALVRYLHMTTELEVGLVNDVAGRLAAGDAVLDLPPGMRLRARQLYCDEAYHALVCADLLTQLGSRGEEAEPAFAARLNATIERHAIDPATLRFLFAVVTETCISRSLANLARNRSVRPAIREWVADHARDEARHHTFFSALFASFWSQRTETERRQMGAALPDLLFDFLAPDLEGVGAELASVGLGVLESQQVLEESYAASDVRNHVLEGAHPALVCFRRAGAFARANREAFEDAGLAIGAGR